MFGKTAGSQCVPNCLAAAAFSTLKKVNHWTKSDIDMILITGNELYGYLQASSTLDETYILINELPKELEIFNTMFTFCFKEPIATLTGEGMENTNWQDFNSTPLYESLQISLMESDACFVCFSGNTMLIGKQDNGFFIFDSHSRSQKGLFHAEGKSTCVFVTELQDVYYHIHELTKSMQIFVGVECEITGVKVSNSQQNNKESDDVTMVSVSTIQSAFVPLPFNVQKHMCELLAIPLKEKTQNVPCEIQGQTNVCHEIKRDGNCFFRAISYAISNSECNHFEIRKSVCKYALQERDLLQAVLRPGFESVTSYIQSLSMDREGVWATEFEIVCTALLLHCDIYIYSQNKWLKYSAAQWAKNIEIIPFYVYLDHENECHYNVVLSTIDNRGFTMGEKNQSPQTISDQKDKNEMQTGAANDKCEKSSEHTYNITESGNKNNIDPKMHIRAKWRDYQRERYVNDTEFKNKKKEQMKRKYQEDPFYNQDNKQRSKIKYSSDESFREDVKQRSKVKYSLDELFKDNKKQKSIVKYSSDELFREDVKQRSKVKYSSDELFKEDIKRRSKVKYNTDQIFKEEKKSKKRLKYSTDNDHKQKVLHNSKEQYKNKTENIPLMLEVFAKKKRTSRNDGKRENAKVNTFKTKVSQGPVYACSCCHRHLFKDQVQTCKEEVYEKKNRTVAENAKACISKKYLHVCHDKCLDDCSRSELWICKTCHRKLINNNIPHEASMNSLELENIPDELNVLNSLEQHLIALHIPFMKVVSLPQGGQNAVHGPVVCVPSQIKKTTCLPRREDLDLILRVKLKRKMVYKGYYEYQFVNTNHIFAALEYLKKNNKWYSSVSVNLKDKYTEIAIENDENSPQYEIEHQLKETPDIVGSNKNFRNITSTKHDSEIDKKTKRQEDKDNEECGVQYDTCLQPTDIGQEVLDHYFDEIYNLAPAEGMNPVKLLQEQGNEAKCFPVLFPSGRNTFDEKRGLQLTLARYFNIRLMNADNRFAKDTNYIFYCQYLSELKQVIDKTQISMRKSIKSGSNNSTSVTEAVQNTSDLKTLIRKDEALRFLQPIRGTPSYWEGAQKDLFAMLRQLGIPTWFCSFSAAEFRWRDMVNVILKQQADTRTAEDLDWTEKSKILKSNPVTVARMFDHRFRIFLREVILSPANPIGYVNDFFFRVEFQQRGSPHVHCLFWVKDAPKLDKDGEDAVCDFIDQYVTCKLPSKIDNPELHDIVNSVQQHSKKTPRISVQIDDTNGGKRPGKSEPSSTDCDKPLSTSSQIDSTDGESDQESPSTNNEKSLQAQESATKDKKQEALKLLGKVWEAVQKTDQTMTCKDLFETLGLDQSRYEDAHMTLASRQSVVLERNPSEVWVNQYNAHLLRCWDANMDIQFVLDPFSCIVYIISYISKAEREMGMLLQQTKIESEEGNLNARQTMKVIGSTYLNHREVGVQEAVYRVCGLHMKECSRQVVYIPVGENPTRLTKPLSPIKKRRKADQKDGSEEDSGDDDESDDDIWMTNIVERYQSRPHLAEFEKMCLAEFCSLFRVLAKSQVPCGKTNEKVYQLCNGKGYVQKRSRSDPAIIRYARFSEQKQPEEYYQSVLQLFLPYWTLNQLKPSAFDLYQSFFHVGFVKFKGNKTLSKVKEVVEKNRCKFVKHEKALVEAEEYFQKFGVQEDAWASLCPETEMQRHECRREKNMKSETDDDKEERNVDLENDEKHRSDIPFRVTSSNTQREEMLPILRSLNVEQSKTFYFIRNWCLQKSQEYAPEPFHIFITGGAGTGKSHLLKAIDYEASRLLTKTCVEPDKQTVLLTAFTGTAAFNIGGCTIHHALKFNRGFPIPYEPLKEQSLNSLRTELESLQILVIDEVSMVFKRLLYYIHERLVQIKKKKEPFGGVSILAVGDFYQLPPVEQSKSERLFSDNGSYPIDYWKEYFSIVVLTEVMRQRQDLEFAQALNSVRTRTTDTPLPQETRNMISECTREGPADVLHVYATNKEVNQYNSNMLKSICSDFINVEARDFKKDKRTGKLNRMEKAKTTAEIRSLPASILLAKGAKVMLTRNVDVSDGLVNGATGTVTSLINYEKQVNGKLEMKAVAVTFDNKRVGLKSGNLTAIGNQVCIERVEEELKKSNITRHQFPIKLAWACTAHKVQGMTTDKVVVNLDKIFSPGQAYVALSRVTRKEGLFIEISDETDIESKIYADEEVEASMRVMPRLFEEVTPEPLLHSKSCFEILLFNIQSLRQNIEQLRADKRFLSVEIICLTETWLRKEHDVSLFSLHDYTLVHKEREDSYDASSKTTSDLKGSLGGGIAMYVKDGLFIETEHLPVKNIEGLMCKILDGSICLVLIYRPPKYPVSIFKCHLTQLLQAVSRIKDIKGTIIMGDFNENALTTNGPIKMLMEHHGYQQKVFTATTEDGTLIDHVYISGSVKGSYTVVPTYYSYHEAVMINIMTD